MYIVEHNYSLGSMFTNTKY